MRQQLPHERFDQSVARMAARQYGVFSFDQVQRAGGTASMVRDRITRGRWGRVHRGVYVLAGTAVTAEQAAMAACLATGWDSCTSHLTAAGLWRFERIPTAGLHVCSPRRARVDGVTWHRGFNASDRTRIGPIPVTRPERTLIDIAPMVREAHLEMALDDGLRRGLVRLDRLESRIEALAGSGRVGLRTLRRLLDKRVGRAVSGSALETMLLRARRDLGLPVPVPQYEVREAGRFVARVDFAYPQLKIAIEADSRRYHSQPWDWEHDLARRNGLTSLGWLVIHVTWRELRDRPGAVGDCIARVIESRRA